MEDYVDLRQLLKNIPNTSQNLWGAEYLATILDMLKHPELDTLAQDLLGELDGRQREQEQSLWLLYDDLDEDLHDSIRNDALIGLFQLIQTSDARKLTHLRFKIFLREDIWQRLNFTNKSHLNGRDILLQWTKTDFLRMARRQALLSEEFKQLVERTIPFQSLEQASDETVERALQLLWGNHLTRNAKSSLVSNWIYNRLTDTSNTTFPRSFNRLLHVACEVEKRALQTKTTSSSESAMDRLLRQSALNEGLRIASQQRCQDMREEYPELQAFFDVLRNAPMFPTKKELQGLWEECQRPYTTFENFVEMIRSIGLIAVRSKEQDYRFAEIYTYGFEMKRRTGYQ